MHIYLSGLNFNTRQNVVYKSFSLNLKPKILSADTNTTSTQNSLSTIQEFKENEKIFNQKIDKKVLEAEHGMINIYFKDPITQKLTRSALSSESLSKLGQEFSSKELQRRNDGSYVLSGKAESFIAGWYADIAYTRGYLAADKDKDGFMSRFEIENTRSGFTPHSLEGNLFAPRQYVESYITLKGNATLTDGTSESFKHLQQSAVANELFSSKTIGLELDKMVKKDQNLDGKLTYAESGLELESSVKRFDELDESEFSREELKNFFANPGHNVDENLIETSLKYLSQANENLMAILYFKNEKNYEKDKTADMNIKKLFDKIASGTDFEKLSKEDKNFLKTYLREKDKVFDELKDDMGNVIDYIFNQEKFDKYYQEFVENFKQKSANFLGLKKEDALNLNYDNLSAIVDELAGVLLETHSTGSYADASKIIDLKAVNLLV